MDSRLKSALALYAFFVLGVFLVVVPWTPVWDEATRRALPAVGGWPLSGWVRGLVSALGLLDLLVGLQVAGEMLAGSGSQG